METKEWRKQRLQALAAKFGGHAALGRLLGYRDGAFVGQMIKGSRPITEKTVATAEALPDCAGWFDAPDQGRRVIPVDLNEHPDLISVRRGKLKLQAGIAGFAVEVDNTPGSPIFFRADWLQERGYKPYSLLALRVTGKSMEPRLFDGDVVVINTDLTEPKDGEVYAINYEGEPMIKRLVRDEGAWWMASDNPDKTSFPTKKWVDRNSILVGRVIHRQSEHI
ncbi:helix-turn-helix transcriptional regulator [Caenimonas terrae]|uniref:Helix-turn-helix transcriptional regulator n=1 Tax=Caenimonas terrae TaxID=696074 RepID=A0ABW0NBX0_9BURK